MCLAPSGVLSKPLFHLMLMQTVTRVLLIPHTMMGRLRFREVVPWPAVTQLARGRTGI